jgi:hypothetical protein
MHPARRAVTDRVANPKSLAELMRFSLLDVTAPIVDVSLLHNESTIGASYEAAFANLHDDRRLLAYILPVPHIFIKAK